MNKSRFIISLLTVVLFSTAAWGEILSPTLDVLYRANSSVDGWNDTNYPKQSSIEGATDFECNWNQRMMVVQQYDIPNFTKVKTITLTLSASHSEDNLTKPLALWNFPYDMPLVNSSETADQRTAFFNNVKDVTGKTIGTNEALTSQLKEASISDGKWVFTIDATQLKPYKYEGTTAKVNLLITSKNGNENKSGKYFSNNSSNAEANRPKLEVTYYDNLAQPIKEYNYRFKPDGSDWNDNNAIKTNTEEKFETRCAYVTDKNVYMFSVLQFCIENFDKSDKYTLVLHKETNASDLFIWDFNYALPTSTSESASTLIGNIETTTGVDMSESTFTFSNYIQTVSCSDNKWTFAIPADQLTPVYQDEQRTIVNLLIASQGQAHVYTSKEGNTNKPALTKAGSYYAKIGTAYYESFNGALDVVTDEQTITLLRDATTSTQVRKDGATITIDGNNYTLTTTHSTNAPFLTSTGNITLKNITIDGNSTSIAKNLIESGNTGTFTLQNVTIQNAKSSENSGVVCTKGNNGNHLVLDNVTFKNCENTGDKKAILLLGNSNCVAKHSLTFIDCIGNEIFVEGDNRLEVDGTFASNVVFTLASNRNELKAIAKGNGTTLTADDMSKFSEDSNAWEFYFENNEIKARHYTALALNDDSDNASELEAANGQIRNVTLTRTINVSDGNTYITFCAPFAITRAALDQAFGCSSEVLRYKYTSVVSEVATLVFDDDVEDMEAGVPYLIKPLGAVSKTELTFNGVTIDKTLLPAEDSHYQFIPLFSREVVSNTGAVDKSVVYLGAGNQLYWAGATCTINGFRAYLKAKNPESPAMKAVKRMVIDRYNTPTGIENTSAKLGESQKILRDGQIVIIRDGIEYNLMGQKVK